MIRRTSKSTKLSVSASRLARLALVALLVASPILSVAVGAQSVTTTSEENQSSSTTSTQYGPAVTTGTTVANGTNGTNGKGSGGSVIGGIGHWAGGAVGGVYDGVANVGQKAIGKVVNATIVPLIKDAVLKVPPLRLSGPLGLTGHPDSKPYKKVTNTLLRFGIMPLVVAFIFAGIGFGTVQVVDPRKSTFERGMIAGRLVGGIALGFVFALPIMAFLHRATEAMVDLLAPSNAQFADVGILIKLVIAGSTTLFIGKRIEQLGWDVIVALGIMYALIYVAMLIVPIASPLLFAGMCYGPERSRGFCKQFMWHYLFLLGSKPAAAFTLSFALFIDWAFSLSGIFNIFVTLVLLAVVAFMPLIFTILAWVSRRHALAAGSALTGAFAGGTIAATVTTKVSGAKDRMKTKVKEKGKQTARAGAAAASGGKTEIAYRAKGIKDRLATDGGENVDSDATSAAQIRDMDDSRSRAWDYSAPSNRTDSDR